MTTKQRDAETRSDGLAKDGTLPPFDPFQGTETPGFREWFAKHPEAEIDTVLKEVYATLGLAH